MESKIEKIKKDETQLQDIKSKYPGYKTPKKYDDEKYFVKMEPEFITETNKKFAETSCMDIPFQSLS